MEKDFELQELMRASILSAIGLVLPLCFHAVKDGGSIFLPMHIPVIIGGFLLKPKCAATFGMLIPALSHLFTGMPQFPFIYIMILELATYGLAVSILRNKLKLGVYTSLIIGMVLGRIVNIIGTYAIIYIIMSQPFGLEAVAAGLFIKGIPGIIIQLILIPIIILRLCKSEKVVALLNE